MSAPSPLPPVFLLTAPGRDAILAGTLARWAATGWPAPPIIHHDPAPVNPEPRRGEALTRIPAAWRSMLARALAETDAPHVLLLEDDLDFAPGLPARLAAWEPLRLGAITAFASLFNPGVKERASAPGDRTATHFLADPRSVFGTQALLLSRDFAIDALREWPALPGFPSMRLAALAERLGRPIHYHRPSLVQHTGTVSSWGAHIHRAVDFQSQR